MGRLFWFEPRYALGMPKAMRPRPGPKAGPKTRRPGLPPDVVSELCLRHLFRHPMAADLAELLAHERPEIRVRACVALRELASLAAARELVGALDDEHAEVRQAALEALTAASGLELPPEPAPWIEALALDR